MFKENSEQNVPYLQAYTDVFHLVVLSKNLKICNLLSYVKKESKISQPPFHQMNESIIKIADD